MDSSLILSDILDSSVLFFFIGAIAVFLKSELKIPSPLLRIFSLYLLFTIGFKGGHKIHESGIDTSIAITLIAAIVMAFIVLIYSFFTIGEAFLNGSVFMPVFNALAGIFIANALGRVQGDRSCLRYYARVPPTSRFPKRIPSLYISMALALTFPFNIIIGIPIYLETIN